MPKSEANLRKSLLFDLAQGAIAETLTEEQRSELHVDTPLREDFLTEQLQEGKHIILTGNPGDGKTQFILRQQERISNLYTETDVSMYSDYGEDLLPVWKEELETNNPGILAINEGPLHEIISDYSSDFPFLDTVSDQLRNQIVFGDEPDIDFDDIVVIDLTHQNILSRDVITGMVDRLTRSEFLENHGHAGKCHIQHNIENLRDERVKESIVQLLTKLATSEVHVNIRHLINFLAYTIVGDTTSCDTEFSEDREYYNLLFEGQGKLFDLFREHYEVTQLTHPDLDYNLWMDVEESFAVNESATYQDVLEKYQTEYRRFLFENETFEFGIRTGEVLDLYQQNAELINISNGDIDQTAALEQTLRRINSYFEPNTRTQSHLRLWFSHRYRAKDSQALVSRNELTKHAFDIETPRFNSMLQEAFEESYASSEYVFAYDFGEERVQLEIDSGLHEILSSLDIGIPYILRDRQREQQLFKFMNKIEYQESYSETRGEVRVKDTETGNTTEIRVTGDGYDLS